MLATIATIVKLTMATAWHGHVCSMIAYSAAAAVGAAPTTAPAVGQPAPGCETPDRAQEMVEIILSRTEL